MVERAFTSEPSSDRPRTAAVLAHLLALAFAFAILDRSPAPAGRIGLLALFAAASWFRTVHRGSWAPGGFSWRDALLAAAAAGTYQVAFAWLGGASTARLDLLDAAAVILGVAGTSLGAAADRVRRRFHAGPGNAHRLCASGPFALVRYPRYLGDLARSSGWALATRSTAAWILVCAHAAVVLLVYAPALDRRLAGRHGSEFRAWAARTWRVLPPMY